MYSAMTVKQSLVVRKLAAHLCASDGDRQRADT